MTAARYTVGVDFGTESGRAVLVDVTSGAEIATAVHRYANGVIVDQLPQPDGDVRLGADWALQDPADYVATLGLTIPRLLAGTGIDPAHVIGLGIDFTSCTMLPATAEGRALCQLPEFRREPHAWVKLWKHHAAQPQADRINVLARSRQDSWLALYGGRISAEWFYAKSLQILDEAPHVYRAAERLIEAADWIVWQLVGKETRNACTAGYKAIWSRANGFPPEEFFAGLDPRLASIVDEKMSRTIAPLGSAAGGISAAAARLTGLLPGTPVAVANVDAHVSVPAVGVTNPGTMVAVMGTSTCHLVLGSQLAVAEGMCGVVQDGIIPGLFGYEAGQSAVGDIFAWFTEKAVPPNLHRLADKEGANLYQVLERGAERVRPGESGLLALDWWNGNRSILVDADLSGLVLGLTMASEPAEIYRALLEATAYGTRTIIESFESAGVHVDSVVACGGLPEQSSLLMQIYSDVTQRPIHVAGSSQAPAVGSAMYGAVAAGVAGGGYESIEEAVLAMARPHKWTYLPDKDAVAVYDVLFREYRALHDYFGRESDVMKVLKRIRNEYVTTAATVTS